MRTAVLMVCCCACAAIASAQGRTPARPNDAVRFQPRILLESSSRSPLYAVASESEQRVVTAKYAPQRRFVVPGSMKESPDVEIICGMTVIKKDAEMDPKIVVRPDPSVRGAIRRIQPNVCTSAK